MSLKQISKNLNSKLMVTLFASIFLSGMTAKAEFMCAYLFSAKHGAMNTHESKHFIDLLSQLTNDGKTVLVMDQGIGGAEGTYVLEDGKHATGIGSGVLMQTLTNFKVTNAQNKMFFQREPSFGNRYVFSLNLTTKISRDRTQAEYRKYGFDFDVLNPKKIVENADGSTLMEFPLISRLIEGVGLRTIRLVVKDGLVRTIEIDYFIIRGVLERTLHFDLDFIGRNSMYLQQTP